MANRFLDLSEAHLLQPRLHDELVEQVAALQVVQPCQVLQAAHLLVVHEQVHSIDAHGLEVAPELHISDNTDQVAQQTLQAAALLDTVSDPLVKGVEAALRGRHLWLHPGSEVERVVEDFLMRGAPLQLL